MFDIVLVHPLRFKGQNEERSFEYGQKFMPLGLLSIGSFLEEKGLKVKIIDAPMNSNYLADLENTVRGETTLVGFSVMTVHIESALIISSFIKSINQKIPVVWGGIHPSFYPEMTIKNKLIDYVVFGEGEYTILELLHALKNKGSLSNIDGLIYKINGEIKTNRPRDFIDINQMPFFNYELYDVEKYILKNIDISAEYGGMIKRTIPILAALGCPYNCTFCVNSLSHSRYRSKTVDRILEEIDYAVENYRAEYIRIEDEIFLLKRNKIESFLHGLEKRDYRIHWWASARADFFQPSRLSKSVLKKMKELGCFNLSIGVESGSPRMLEIYKKQITLEQVEVAAALCNKYNFQVSYPFIFGSPHETMEEVFMSLRFAAKLKEKHPRGWMIFHSFRPQPGCELYNESIKLGFNAPKNLEEWIPKARASLRGYCSLSDLPWVKMPEFLEYLTMFGELAFQNMSRIKLALRLSAWGMSLLFRMRLKYNFWSFLFEKEIYFLLKRYGLFSYIRKIFK